MKPNKDSVAEKITAGTLIVEKYRPRLSRLMSRERWRVRNRAMQLALDT